MLRKRKPSPTYFGPNQIDLGAIVLDAETIAKAAACAAARDKARAKAAEKRAAAAALTTPRRCLHCTRDFPSTGPGHRICSPCKSLEVFTSSPSSFSIHASF
jgi:hypothetical protein